MSFLANEIEGSLDDLDSAVIFCPVCKQKCALDGGQTSGLVTTPKGNFVMHKSCVEAWNERATLLKEMGF